MSPEALGVGTTGVESTFEGFGSKTSSGGLTVAGSES